MDADLKAADHVAQVAHTKYLMAQEHYHAALKEWQIAVDAYDLTRQAVIERETGYKLTMHDPAWLQARGPRL